MHVSECGNVVRVRQANKCETIW